MNVRKAARFLKLASSPVAYGLMVSHSSKRRLHGVKKFVLAERHRFYNYKQQEGQKLSDYLAELRKLAATCDWFEDKLTENLRDKFVMGIHNERLLQQLRGVRNVRIFFLGSVLT